MGMRKSEICPGFGEYEGRCPNLGMSMYSSVRCQRCDDLRDEFLMREGFLTADQAHSSAPSTTASLGKSKPKPIPENPRGDQHA